jgi:hypothetical protein
MSYVAVLQWCRFSCQTDDNVWGCLVKDRAVLSACALLFSLLVDIFVFLFRGKIAFIVSILATYKTSNNNNNSIQFNSGLLMCPVNSQMANYRNSTTNKHK